MNIRAFFFLILTSLSFCFSYAQVQQAPDLMLPRLKVDNWQMDQGLPVNSIMTIAQTKDGWMFFGTEEGLVRFDGHDFFLMNKSIIPGLTVNFISTLLGGHDTSLWIGTEGDGLIRYKNDTYVKYNKSNGLSDNRIFALCEDSADGLWIGTSGGGLNYLKNEKISRYNSANGLASDYIRCVLMDARGRIWVGTQKGLSVIENGKIKSYYKKDGLSDDFIETLVLDKNQNLWIGTKSGGLNVFRQDKFSAHTMEDGLTSNAITSLCFDIEGILWIGTNGGGITRMIHGKFFPFTTKDGLSGDLIVSLFEDREGNIWVGTSGTGIDRIKKKSIQTLTIRDGLAGDVILPVFEDHAGVIWLGVAGKGLNRIENGKVQTYTQKDGLPDNLILTICEDTDYTLWIGTAGGGLTSFKDKKFTNYTSATGLTNNVVIALYYDRSGILWAGTTGGGINCFKNGKFTAFTTKEGLSHDNVTCILEDRNGNLWVGTNCGLNKIRDNMITVINQKSGLSNDYILSLYEDKEGNLWVGTASNGFNLIRDGKITQFTTRDGLINEVVLKIIEDDFGYFWISCNKGIYKIKKQDLFDFADLKLKSLTPVLYGKTDGMESTECNGGVSPAGCKTRDGNLLFPTMRGVSIIDPALMKTASSYFSPIYMEGFLVDDQPVKITTPLSIPSYTKRLEFRYAALNYTNPGRIRYRCMLVGFDKDWIECGTHRSAYYTNIPVGDYVFKVMASNENGQWDELMFSEFKFRLKPPFFSSFPFYLIAGIFFLLLIFFVTYYFMARFQRNRLKLLVEERTIELHHKMIAQEQTQEELHRRNVELIIAKEHAEESDRLKSAFLNNISHEIRTPFNSLLGFLSILQNDDLTASERDEYTNNVNQSADRLMNTINDIVEISKIQTGQIKLTITDINISKLARELFNRFDADAKSKRLEFNIINNLPKNIEIISSDSIKLNVILSNLINNAIKFTKAGSIEIGCDLVETHDRASLQFYVKDTGIGIPENKQQAIFDRFIQADVSTTRKFEGAGLGLAISKAYVEMLGGKIWVESEVGKGSTFYFTLPYYAEPEEKKDFHKVVIIEGQDNPVNPEVSGLKILIAEDDEESAKLLTIVLKKFSKEVLKVRTGIEAIETCRNNPDIDLVLMDIQMPEMDGYEATRQIRQFNTGMIIIAQTAYALAGDSEKAIGAGCNDYISKPIRRDKLLEVIQKYFKKQENENSNSINLI